MTPSTTCSAAKGHQLCCLSTPTLHPRLSRCVGSGTTQPGCGDQLQEVPGLLDTCPDVLCVSQVNWTQLLDRNISGGLEVEPKSSVLYSTALVFSKVRTSQKHLSVHLNESKSWDVFVSALLSTPTTRETLDILSGELFVLQLLEYDDVNNTAQPSSSFFPPYDLQKFSWSRFNLSGSTSLLCGTDGAFDSGSLCLQVCGLIMNEAGEPV